MLKLIQISHRTCSGDSMYRAIRSQRDLKFLAFKTTYTYALVSVKDSKLTNLGLRISHYYNSSCFIKPIMTYFMRISLNMLGF
mmetsp:Transcript_1938/g.228  ORF Transcript_1938/g.228 Transcript_1938/m.228 type:complete len:83 (-) Transcript_1938:376-624(-)